MVQSIVLLQASGGECPADIERLRQDAGLPEMLGHALPASETTLKFLKAFHEPSRVDAARQALEPGQLAFIPTENSPLSGLSQVNTDLIRALCMHLGTQQIATVDQDATIIESCNRNATWTYEGKPGY